MRNIKYPSHEILPHSLILHIFTKAHVFAFPDLFWTFSWILSYSHRSSIHSKNFPCKQFHLRKRTTRNHGFDRLYIFLCIYDHCQKLFNPFHLDFHFKSFHYTRNLNFVFFSMFLKAIGHIWLQLKIFYVRLHQVLENLRSCKLLDHKEDLENTRLDIDLHFGK